VKTEQAHSILQSENRAMAVAFLEDMDRYTSLRVEQEEVCLSGDKCELQSACPSSFVKSEALCE